jgi:hypothetical protein
MRSHKRSLWVQEKRRGGGNDFPRGPLGNLGWRLVRGAVGGLDRGVHTCPPWPTRSGQTVDETGSGKPDVGDRRLRARGGDVDPIRRISIRARGMSKAASRGRTHVSTRPYAQTKEQFSLASNGASTHVPFARRRAHAADGLNGCKIARFWLSLE